MRIDLNIDCGTSNDNYSFENEDSYREFMKGEGFDDEITEILLSTGSYWCCPDTYTLEVVYPSYEIYGGSLLERKDGNKSLYVVNSVNINSDGVAEVNTQECWFYNGKLCFDYECYGENTVQEIYKSYNLVGEDFKLFN